MALDRLIEKIAEKQNPTVAGLDPKLDYIPDHIKQAAFAQFGKTMEGAAEAIWVYNRGLIDALCTVVPAVKPQAAYYEMYGWQGMRTLAKTVAYAQEKGMFVIMDGKRNDIGTTMQAYAAAHLGVTEIAGEKFTAFGADALTVNGYLGSDGILPLTAVCKEMDKAIFVLVKTSNPSSGELQNLCLEGAESIYLRMGKMCEKWGEGIPGKYGYSGVGAVVGATYPQQLTELRAELPRTFFLVPGYGAQGATAEDVAVNFDKNGLGAIVNSSRGILCAYKKDKYQGMTYFAAARAAALDMKEDLTAHIGL